MLLQVDLCRGAHYIARSEGTAQVYQEGQCTNADVGLHAVTSSEAPTLELPGDAPAPGTRRTS